MSGVVSLFCPRCGGPMEVQEVEVRFRRAPRAVREAIVVCTECPAATQVQNVTGNLIDIPGWCMEDLQCPPEDFTYLMPNTRITDRRDS